jgi:death on curing protein
MKIEIKKIGNSDGLLLPRELMQRLDLKRGQELHITELAGGGFQAMPYDPDFEKTMEIADQIMDKYRDTLAALAKWAETHVSEPKEPLWITFEQAVAIHSRQLRRFGGAPGLRDQGMLRSALERPINKWRYEQADMAELAAAHAFGLAKNHAFVDGNKRVAFMAMAVFLLKNGVAFDPDPAQSTTIILALAAGEVSEEGLTRWIGDNWPAEPARR